MSDVKREATYQDVLDAPEHMSDVKREATYQDVLDAPEHMVAEILDGELVLSPRPTSVASVLGGERLPPFSRGRSGPGGWIILDEPELHFVRRIVVPDLAAWRPLIERHCRVQRQGRPGREAAASEISSPAAIRPA